MTATDAASARPADTSSTTPSGTSTDLGADQSTGAGSDGAVGIAAVLERARARLARVDVPSAIEAQCSDAALVDIRPQAQRDAHGEIPGALVIDRNVLQWRLDPTSGAALPIADRDLPIVVVCQQGYSSSLAATELLDCGLRDVTDLIGGHDAWVAHHA